MGGDTAVLPFSVWVELIKMLGEGEAPSSRRVGVVGVVLRDEGGTAGMDGEGGGRDRGSELTGLGPVRRQYTYVY